MLAHPLFTLARAIPLALSSGQYSALYDMCSNAFRDEVSREEFISFAADFHRDLECYEEQPLSVVPLNAMTRFVWTACDGQKGLSAAIDADGIIHGLRLSHLTSHPDTDQACSRHLYRLPFQGTWFTFWGGKNELINYHYAYDNQRYAYDFLIMQAGRSCHGDPAVNESYYAFDQPIVAPCAGKVVKIANEVPDNVPVGVVNEEQPAGNFVEIDHGQGEFSLLAHLKQHSVSVKPGDVVSAGEIIGRCGNSGNSSEPHLHFQVSNALNLYTAISIPIRFSGEEPIIQGMFVSG
ncbi:metalloendopeptidase [Brevibacillus parabrevis]|uniref:M23 family metallopeptidase n=1 Tax=Brevibacillus parabrevis TaxID=54914 RepID=UPI0007ABA20C|nr:M23 family metallopeptidase [Brevibacillus parabrevis]KZE47038.1 metalloendopeptidase [Brevibacillus parabrevis]